MHQAVKYDFTADLTSDQKKLQSYNMFKYTHTHPFNSPLSRTIIITAFIEKNKHANVTYPGEPVPER